MSTTELTAAGASSDAPARALADWRPAVITEPGVYPHLRFEDYIKDPVPGGSLSNSEIKHLMPPDVCPARFRWEKDHKRPVKRVFEIGTAAHALVLGVGPALVEIEADSWRKDETNRKAENARADGAVPLLTREYRMVQDMAAALRAHPVASALFAEGCGMPEQSLFWRDKPTGVTRRARLDWLPVMGDRRLIIGDYKTCNSVAKDALSKAMNNYGYHIQAATYIEGVRALGIDERPGFVNVYQEKTPPYLVRIVEPDAMALAIARDRIRAALELYAKCEAEGEWPGYPEPELLGLPVWVENEYLRETS